MLFETKGFLCLVTLFCQCFCSQFNENVLISSSYPMEMSEIKISYPTQLEFWSFYVANWKTTSYPWIEQQPDPNKQKYLLLFLIKTAEDQKVFAFMFSNPVTTIDYITHTMYVDGKTVDLYFNPSQYEGVWILNTISFYKNLLYYDSFGPYYNDYYYFSFKQFLKNIQFYVGGSGIILNKYELSIFKGRLSKLFFYYYEREISALYWERINVIRQNEHQERISLIPDLVNFDGVIQKEFEFDQFGRKFCLFGWAKYYTLDAYLLKKYLLVRLTIFKNYLDEINIGDEILKVTVDINLSNKEQCGYDVISHHTFYPYPDRIFSKATNFKVSLRNDLPYFELLSKWHFISFEYGLDKRKDRKTQFRINYFDNQILKSHVYELGDQKYNTLFTNTKYYAFFGGDYTVYDKMKGQLVHFYFVSNLQTDLNIKYYCHYSCLTCDGPLISNCLSCHDNNERVFLEDFHQCVCPIGQFEKEQQCQSYSDLYPQLNQNEIKVELSKSQCLFGYFYLPANQQCIKCPQWNSYDLFCADCILNPSSWYIKPICTIDYITQQTSLDQDAYTQQIRSTIDYDLYYIDNNYQLILLEGVYNFCDITKINIETCQEFGIQHLQNSIFGFCKQNRYYTNFNCVLLDQACTKVNINEKKCLQCLTGYYISDDGTSCLECSHSCKNCFSLNKCLSCEPGYGLKKDECQKCGNFCKACKFSERFKIMQCLMCSDNQLYFLSLNAQDCKINEKQNCIYAYEIGVQDKITNSLDHDFQPYQGETIMKCAKCKKGYYFHDSYLNCLHGYIDNCEEFYESRIDNYLLAQICLFGSYNPNLIVYSFIDQCSKFKLNFVYCLVQQITAAYDVNQQLFIKKASHICLVCDNGYYAVKKTGQCQSCPLELHCLSCFQQNKFTKDNWKNDIRSFYSIIINRYDVDHKFIDYGLSQNDLDYEIICSACLPGYELNGEQCIEICPEKCLECVLLNNKNVCVKCQQGLNGRNRGLVNNKCINCPFNCEFCKERDQEEILSINPMFQNQDFLYFSNYCIIGFSGIQDQQLGLYVECQDGPCIKQIIFNLNLICNADEYYDQIAQFQKEEDKIKFQQDNILSDHLFSTQNFAQFEKKEFYQMTNEQQIKQIIIRITSQKQQICLVNDQLQISQNFSANIFSAIDVELEIQGNNITTFKFQKQLFFINFKRVRIEGIQFEIQYFVFGPNLLKFTSLFNQTVEIVDVIYQQDYNLTTFYIIIENSENVLIQNFFVKNCTRQFQIQALIKIEQIKSFQTIKIQNFKIMHSSFFNTNVFYFDLKENDVVEIKELNIEQSVFNQSLILQSKGSLKMKQIHIFSCLIYSQMGLLTINNLKHFELISFDFKLNSIYSGKIINLNPNSILSDLNFEQNKLYNNSLLIYNAITDIEYIYMEKILFSLNQHSDNTKFIKINSTILPKKEIIMNQIQLLKNELVNIPNLANIEFIDAALIYLEISFLQIQDLIIQKAYGIPDLFVVNANELKLSQIIIKQLDNQPLKGLFQDYDCLSKQNNNQNDYIWIQILNVPNIDIQQISISKAYTKNQPFIQIKSSILKTQIKKIFMSEMYFNGNLLLTTNKFNTVSLIQISSEEDYKIEIKNSIFERNIMHQYISIDQINSGLVFFFDCTSCTLLLNNLQVLENIVTNSSNSIIFIQSKSIIIENSTFIKNSLFDYQILQPYLYWGFLEDQEIFIEQIQETFPIIVKTGNGKIICQYIVIQNIIISNSSRSGFEIHLEKEASMYVKDTVINSIIDLFMNENENGGAFLIDSSTSVTSDIQFKNISANNIYCRNKGGLIYIQNIQESTTIQLNDIFINDVYSLKGSIFYVEFSLYGKSHQQFKLENLYIRNNQQGYLRFMNKFNQLNQKQLLELKLGRSLFEISYAKIVSIKNLQILQLFQESLGILNQISSAEIQNCNIINSTTLNSLIRFQQMQNNSTIRIVNFQGSNIEILDQIPIKEKCNQMEINIQFEKQICQKEMNLYASPISLQYKQMQDSLSNSYCIINQINLQQSQPISGLIDINPQATQIFISDLFFFNIYCKICQKGLLNVNIQEDQTIIIMNNIFFENNQCGQLSCLNIIKDIKKFRILQTLFLSIHQKKYDFQLQNFRCISNFAYKGTCLYIQNITTLIKNSIFENNTAESQGGSIYVLGFDSFYILNSLVQYNKAQSGGGLYFQDQISQNLIKQGSIIEENIATVFGNNFAQLPSQLKVTLDLQNFLPKIKILEREDILIEEIQIQQNQIFQNATSNILYVPNGQPILKYQYFDQQKKEYIAYNLHLRLSALDQFNNIQENLNDTKCQINGRILNENEDLDFTQNFTSLSSVLFDQSEYNFDNIIFYLDDQQNLTLQLQFNCNSIFIPIYGKNQEITGYHNNYFIRMNIKSLPCQIGEIKSLYDGTCQPCNASQGLYSLVLNSNNCSQKDDFSTIEIKSAQLKLKPGFWRPYFDTDQISQCINLLSNCNGGWIEGDISCFYGHVGALCEECDIYNLRGQGHFSTSSKYSCGSCVDNNQNIVAITAISIWTLISILISVKSNIKLNEQMILKKIISRIFLTKIQYHSNFGILIKLTTHHLQIVSVIFTFKFQTPVDVDNFFNSVSNPIQTITHSLDCFLLEVFVIPIHYSRIIWQLFMPFIYIMLFLGLYWIALFLDRLQYNLNVITTTLIYMYIYLQPYLVGGLISLISYRQISGFQWIQANVNNRYDTEIHQNWLLRFCLPVLILIAIIIPLFFFISLYSNKSKLHLKRTRQKWGYLYNEYKLDAYYWELIKIVIKELLIIFLSYYEENIVKKGILLLSLVYLYQELSQKYQPFVSYILNNLDAYSAKVCVISIAVGIGIYIDQLNQSYEIQIPYLLILLTFNLHYFIRILKEIVSSYVDENAFFFDTIKEYIIVKFPKVQQFHILKKLFQNRNEQKKRIALRFFKLKKYLIIQAQNIIRCKQNYGVKIISQSTQHYSYI